MASSGICENYRQTWINSLGKPQQNGGIPVRGFGAFGSTSSSNAHLGRSDSAVLLHTYVFICLFVWCSGKERHRHQHLRTRTGAVPPADRGRGGNFHVRVNLGMLEAALEMMCVFEEIQRGQGGWLNTCLFVWYSGREHNRIR